MNFVKRAITGIVFVAIVTACLLAGELWAMALCSVATALSTAEFVRIVNAGKGIRANVPLAVLTAVLSNLAVCSLCGVTENLFAGKVMAAMALLSVILILICEIFGEKESPALNIAVALMPIIYIALPFSLIPILGITNGIYSGILPLMLFIFIWCNDVGAYCVGCTLGRHRLFPRISPKKSWEGSIGGAVLTIAAAVAAPLAMPGIFVFLPLSVWVATALVTVVAGTFGDLTESLLKRELGIKDSGNALPGHGGFLDRFDSTLMAVPAVTVLLLLIAL